MKVLQIKCNKCYFTGEFYEYIFPKESNCSFSLPKRVHELFHKILNYTHDGGSYHIETIPMIYSANKWTCFYMIGNSVMKELIGVLRLIMLQ